MHWYYIAYLAFCTSSYLCYCKSWTSGGPIFTQLPRCTSTGLTSSQSCSMGARHGPSPKPWLSALMPSTPGVCGKFFGSRTPDTLQMSQVGTIQAACQSLKGSRVLRAPGPVESRGRPPSCHRCRTTYTIWLEETRRSSKNHLAENDWGGPAVTEFRGSHGMEEGKGERYLASVRQRSARSSPPRRRSHEQSQKKLHAYWQTLYTAYTDRHSKCIAYCSLWKI